MAFQITPLQISQRQTDFGNLGALAANVGQQFLGQLDSARKDQQAQARLTQEQKMRDEYARIGKAVADGTINNRAAAGAVMGLGDIGTGFNFLKLDEAAKDRASDADLIRGLGTGGPQATLGSPVAANTPQNLAPLFTQAQAKYGLPEGYLPRVAQIESSNNPNAQNPNSSAGGLFQFIDSTARNYGLTNKFDPAAATDAAARLAVDNKSALTQALGREPTAGELYLAHQHGAGGASRLLANPNARAVDIVGERAVSLNGGNPNMTAAEFASKWVNKVDGSRPVQMAQAAPQLGAPVSDVPAQGASEAQFVIPGTNTTVDQQTLSSNPRIQNMVRALGLARTDAAKSTISKMLELEIADAKQRQAMNQPTDVQRNYELARRQGYQGSLLDYQKELRAQTNVSLKNEGSIPAGYRAVRDAQGNVERLEPIPGSEADQKAKAAADKQAKAERIRAEVGNSVGNALDDIDRLMKDATLPTSGPLGGRLAGIPGTNAYDIAQSLSTIKANISFDKLQQMRESSPTGGALGSVTEGEQKLLQDSYAALSQSQSPTQFKTNLGRTRAIFERIVHGRTLTAQERKTGGPMTMERAKGLRDQAREAIAGGAPRDAVMKRLKEDYGISTDGL